MLKLDDVILLHLIVKGVVNELHWCDGRNGLWCAKDGGRGVCSSDEHHLVQKPISAAQMQFTHEGFNDWGGRGYDDFVPGEVIKTAPSGDKTT